MAPLNKKTKESFIKDVKTGPKIVTGILSKENANPHRKHVSKAYGTPFDNLSRLEFLKSLILIEINIIPIKINDIDKMCIEVIISEKNKTENIVVNMIDELEIEEITPTFPFSRPLKKLKIAKYPMIEIKIAIRIKTKEKTFGGNNSNTPENIIAVNKYLKNKVLLTPVFFIRVLEIPLVSPKLIIQIIPYKIPNKILITKI